MADSRQLLRRLPAVDAVLARDDVSRMIGAQPRAVVVEGIRMAIESRRAAMLAGEADSADIDARDVERALREWLRPALRAVINATGIIVHTNLGRAPLAEAAIRHLADVGRGYCNLEMDLVSGRRGSRMDGVRQVLLERTGAEAALVVNNNAAAVYLALRSLAAGREVIVSRGELVEIGGSFRIPDVMAASGAKLVEVGTTNKTHLSDYERAMGPETAMILKVHRSNFAIVGFTEEVELADLTRLASSHRIPVVMDAGSAMLLERQPGPLAELQNLRDVMRADADLVCFSGDKLLGGPQCGILLGKREIITRLATDPMARALRVGKLTLAALGATLSLYRGGDESARQVPVVGMLLAQPEELAVRAEKLLKWIRQACPTLDASVQSSSSQVGGGSLPMFELQSVAVAVRPDDGKVDALAERLRTGEPAVLGRVQRDHLLLDMRTLVDDAQLQQLVAALSVAVGT